MYKPNVFNKGIGTLDIHGGINGFFCLADELLLASHNIYGYDQADNHVPQCLKYVKSIVGNDFEDSVHLRQQGIVHPASEFRCISVDEIINVGFHFRIIRQNLLEPCGKVIYIKGELEHNTLNALEQLREHYGAECVNNKNHKQQCQYYCGHTQIFFLLICQGLPSFFENMPESLLFYKVQNRSEQIGQNQAINNRHGNRNNLGHAVFEIGAPEHQEKEAYTGPYDKEGRDAPIKIFFVPAEFHIKWSPFTWNVLLPWNMLLPFM